MYSVKSTNYSIEEVQGRFMAKGIKATNCEKLISEGYSGKGVRIGVIDTGCSPHTFYNSNLVCGKNCINGTDNYVDETGHGSFCVGEIVQIAPNCEIIIAKVLGKDGHGSHDSVNEGIKYCIEQGCNIISMSLGGSEYNVRMHDLIKDAVENKDILVCVASGNEGDGKEGTNEIMYPASFEEVVDVGAIDINSKMADFSNSSPWVDVCANGVNMTSTYFKSNKWCNSSGTSMSTPIVAGFCALLMEKFTVEYGRKPSEKELYSQLIKHTKDLGISRKLQGNGMIYYKGE